MTLRLISSLRILSVFSALAMAAGAGALQAVPADGLAAEEIVGRFIDAQSASSEMAFIRMEVLRAGERTDERRLLAVYEKGPGESLRSLIRVVRPEEVEGVTVLAVSDAEGVSEQSIYLPSIGRTRPLAGEAHAAPFLGSDFTYADLLDEIPGRQHYARRKDAFAMGAPCFVIRATPREEGAPYGHRDLYIEQKTFRLYRIDYYDQEGGLIKSLNCYDYESPRIFGDTTRPHRAVMSNAQAGTSTIFTVIAGRIGDDFDDAYFTPRFIENWTAEAVEEFLFQFTFEITGPSGGE
jgi:hypothetical protein